MLKISNLIYTYPESEKPALNIPELNINRGSFTLVSGLSGSGKSTLLRLSNGLVPHFSGGNLKGKISVYGYDPVIAGPHIMSNIVGFVFQEPENQFVVDIVEDELAFAMENCGVSQKEMQNRIELTMEQLKISHLRQRRVDSLSGGEAQLVAIAAAMVFTPKLLVLDEPTSQLDPQAANEMLEILLQLRNTLDLTVIIAEQRLDRVLPFIDQLVYLLPEGKGCISGEPREIIQQIPIQPPVVQLANFLNWSPTPLTVKEAEKFRTNFQNRQNKTIIQPEKKEPVLEIKHLNVNYPDRPVLSDINLKVFQGERLVLMGPNGAGKSTLLRSIMHLAQPESGEIFLFGERIEKKSTVDISHTVGFLPQDPNALLFAETVQEEFEITLHNKRLPIDQTRISDLLKVLNLNERANQYPRDLSTGERQRTALGAVCVNQPPLLILDEPTRGLDILGKENLHKLLLSWNKQGTTILLVTHDVEFAAMFATRIILLENGRLIADGQPGTIFHRYPRYNTQIGKLFPDSTWITIEDLNHKGDA